MSVKLGDNPLGRVRQDKNIVRIMYRRRVRPTTVPQRTKPKLRRALRRKKPKSRKVKHTRSSKKKTSRR
ncbi:MAG: hypothetical protein ACE5KO_02995 [Candidatus Bathyarchaeia archaeon]